MKANLILTTFLFTFSIFYFFIPTSILYCQSNKTSAEPVEFKLPEGDQLISFHTAFKTSYGETIYTILVTPQKINVLEWGQWGPELKDWYDKKRDPFPDFPPKGKDIISSSKKTGNDSTIFVLLNDGTAYKMIIRRFYWQKFELIPMGYIPNETAFKKIAGDAVYILAQDHIYVNRKDDINWEIDSTGLNGCRPTDFTLDSSQYVYAVTNKGYVFKQHPDSSVWHNLTSFPVNTSYSGYLTSIYIDRKDRIYLSNYTDVFISTDHGSSWNKMNDGLTGTKAFDKFGDDAYNNVYALYRDKLYKSIGGTGSWVEIAQSVGAKFLNQASIFSPNYINISGDSVLYLSTKYGVFTSTDQGSSWKENNSGIEATTVYGFARTANTHLVSTNLGVFHKDINNSVWIKSFPVDGFLNGSRIYQDSNGYFYILGQSITALFKNIPTNWKSTDEGNTWIADTAGLGVIYPAQQPVYYADESGVQHYAFYDSPARLYKKEGNTPWEADTAGLNAQKNDLCNSFGNDKNGNLYAAMERNGIGLLYRKPMTGGVWQLDTAGLKGSVVISMNTDETGNMILGTINNGVFKRMGDHWMELLLPNFYTNYVYALASDTKGTIFASFSNLDGTNFTWKGIYSTIDNGVNWKYCGLDSAGIRQMITYGDTIYVVTYVNGIYKIARQEIIVPSSISSNSTPFSFSLSQNYPNPFNPETSIKYQIPADGQVNLKIFDVLGREVRTLVNDYQKKGSYKIPFRVNDLSSGVYIYRLISGDFNSAKKMVIQK